MPWVLAVAACTESTSATDLHSEGPPMVQQVRLTEVYLAGAGPRDRTVFAFGTHPLAGEDEAHAVTTAKASGNKLRIVMDELLRGNNLEEIACRYAVDDDAFARVPVGATPDDVARCAVARDVLPARCPGSDRRSLCVCQNDAGCASGTTGEGTPYVTPKGESVGVLDRDQDGAPDKTRFIDGAVAISCGSLAAPTEPRIDVPIELDLSYWTPSGNQQKPAQGGFDALGPAVVVVPRGALPTGLRCGLVFASDVVDKDDHRVCAPPGGDIERDCTPGDTSAIAFTVEPLSFGSSAITDPGQSRTMDIKITSNAPLDPASLAAITVTEGTDTPYTQFTATLTVPSDAREVTLHWTAAGGLAADTHYTITVPRAVTDVYGQPAPQPFRIELTTGAI